MVAATTVAVLMANTTLYVGPIAAALGGADLSAFAGPILGGGLYAVLWLTTRPYRDPARRPSGSDAAGHPVSDDHDDHDESTTDAAASAHRDLEVPA